MGLIKMICSLGGFLTRDNGIELNHNGLQKWNENAVKPGQTVFATIQTKDHSMYREQVQNVQTNVPAPVKGCRNVCVLNYYASSSTCKLKDKKWLFKTFSPVPLNLLKWSYWK